jgi:hypothetical protein
VGAAVTPAALWSRRVINKVGHAQSLTIRRTAVENATAVGIVDFVPLAVCGDPV